MKPTTAKNIARRMQATLAKLQREIKQNGYSENLGQKEAREFNDWLGQLMTQNKITYGEMARHSGRMHEAVLNL